MLTITANDVDLKGTDSGITTGTAGMTIHGATATQTIGLGSDSRTMQITDTEIGLITTTGLTIGEFVMII